MTYDALNRVTQKTYAGAPGSSPTTKYCYDGKVYDLTTNACVVAAPAIPYPVGKLTGEGVAGWSGHQLGTCDGERAAHDRLRHDADRLYVRIHLQPRRHTGNLTSQTITAPSFSQTQYYGYDGANRLKAYGEYILQLKHWLRRP